MGSKGIVASTAAMGVLLQEGIGDTIRVSLTPEPNGDRTKEVIVAQEILQTMGLRSFTPMVTACPGCGRTTSTFFQELAERIQSYLRDQMPVWKAQYPGVEEMHVAVMGCVVNGPGESKLADIGISLPGSGEKPVAPVYVDGEKTVTLKGERIAEEFQAIVEEYVRTRYARRSPGARRERARKKKPSPSGPSTHDARSSRPSAAWRTCCRMRPRFGKSSRTRAATSSASTATRNIRTPIVEPTALFVRGLGRGHRHRREGDVHLRRPQRREPRAAPRGDGGHRARGDRAQLPLQRADARVDRGPDVPLRAPAEGPPAPVPPVRRRGAGLRGAGRGRRADRDARAPVEGARASRTSSCTSTPSAMRPTARRTARSSSRTSRSTRSSLDEDAKRRLHTNPLRILDSKNPAMQAMIEGAPTLARPPGR